MWFAHHCLFITVSTFSSQTTEKHHLQMVTWSCDEMVLFMFCSCCFFVFIWTLFIPDEKSTFYHVLFTHHLCLHCLVVRFSKWKWHDIWIFRATNRFDNNSKYQTFCRCQSLVIKERKVLSELKNTFQSLRCKTTAAASFSTSFGQLPFTPNCSHKIWPFLTSL